MNKKEHDDLVQRAEGKRKAAIEKVEADFLQTVSAIDRVFALAQEPDAITATLATVLNHVRQVRLNLEGPAAGPAAVVRSVINGMHQFATPEIMDSIRKHFPQQKIESAAVSSVLNKLHRSGEIEIVSKGTGRQPHVYRKASSLLTNNNGQ